MSDTSIHLPEEAIRNIADLIAAETTLDGSGVQRLTSTGTAADDDTLQVLLVARPTRTPTATARVLEDRPSVRVSTAPSGNHALERLQSGQFDCVVSDYELPEMTGIDLLEAVRETNENLPFVLFTDAGSESIASDAITAGVSEYVKKGGRRQRERLADTVNRLAERYHTERGEATPLRFQRVDDLLQFALETTGLYVWDWDVERGTIDRYPDTDQLFGFEQGALEPMFDGFIERVHPNHRDEVAATLRNALDTGSSYQLRYALERPDGSQLWLKERGTVLTDEDGTATRVIGVNRDVTERTERERELTWERDLNRTLHEALVESRTRSELEEAIVEQLHDYGYELAWIGDSLTGELKPRAVAGADAYVEALRVSADEADRDDEPSARAAQERTPQFTENLAARTRTEWHEKAYDRGLRNEAVLPLVYGDVFYGVLAVYDIQPTAFDETARRLLTDLAETLAFVIHNVESENALAADRSISATLQLVGTDYYLRELIQQADCESSETRLMVHETLNHSDGEYIQYVSVNGTSVEAIAEAAANHPTVDAATVIAEDSDPRIQLTHGERTPEVQLTTVGTRVRSTSVTAKRADILIEVSNKSELKTAIETLKSANEFVSVLSSIERDRSTASDDEGPLAALTDRQATALRAAYHRGYFERPRESSATDVAESLGISHPTLLEHLRLAQAKVFSNHFE
jgi:PAS domain S-box-containing protein